MKRYCEECGKEVETKIIIKTEHYDVCGDPIEVDAQVLLCADCGEEFFCEELDNATLVNAYNKYRRNHKLLFPEDIKKIREQYGLSQRSFAKLLNWEIRQSTDMKMVLFRIKLITVCYCFYGILRI